LAIPSDPSFDPASRSKFDSESRSVAQMQKLQLRVPERNLALAWGMPPKGQVSGGGVCAAEERGFSFFGNKPAEVGKILEIVS